MQMPAFLVLEKSIKIMAKAKKISPFSPSKVITLKTGVKNAPALSEREIKAFIIDLSNAPNAEERNSNIIFPLNKIFQMRN